MNEYRAVWRKQIFTLAFYLCTVSFLFGNTFYISTTGSDANAGTSSAPWSTFKHAFQNTGPGDVVLVRGGTYPSETIKGSDMTGGTPDNYLVFKAAPGETPILDNFSQLKLSKDYIRFEGMTFLQQGIAAEGTGCQIVGNTFTGPGFGFGAIHVLGNDLLFEGNTIDVIQNNTLDHGIYVHEGDGITIRNNMFLRSFGYAIHIFGQNRDTTPLPLKNILIEDNYISGSEQRSGIITAFAATNAVDLANITIRNNVITANAGAAIAARQGTNIRIYNNTIYDNQQAISGNSIGPSIFISSFAGSEDVNNVTVSNNIIVTLGGEDHIKMTSTGANIVVDNNLYWPQSSNISGISDNHAIFADPDLVNPSSGDFHIASNSPAIDVGLIIASVTEDFDGNLRPQGNGYDIGAFEFTDSPTSVEQKETTPPDQFQLQQNYPNPFNPSTEITFVVPRGSNVFLAVYNLLGQRVRTLVDEVVNTAGPRKVIWDGRNQFGQSVSSGVYFYRLQSAATVLSRRMVLLK